MKTQELTDALIGKNLEWFTSSDGYYAFHIELEGVMTKTINFLLKDNKLTISINMYTETYTLPKKQAQKLTSHVLSKIESFNQSYREEVAKLLLGNGPFSSSGPKV